jgi:hypothetical protein
MARRLAVPPIYPTVTMETVSRDGAARRLFRRAGFRIALYP